MVKTGETLKVAGARITVREDGITIEQEHRVRDYTFDQAGVLANVLRVIIEERLR